MHDSSPKVIIQSIPQIQNGLAETDAGEHGNRLPLIVPIIIYAAVRIYEPFLPLKKQPGSIQVSLVSGRPMQIDQWKYRIVRAAVQNRAAGAEERTVMQRPITPDLQGDHAVTPLFQKILIRIHVQPPSAA